MSQVDGLSAEQVAAIARLDVRETHTMLTTGPYAQPYRIDDRGRPWFDVDAAGHALGFAPEEWAMRLADYHLARISAGLPC